MSIQRHGVTRRYSDSAVYGDTVYLVEVPSIYFADMADYDAMNLVWDAWVPEGCAPPRACVQARLANSKYRLEMALTAAIIQG